MVKIERGGGVSERMRGGGTGAVRMYVCREECKEPKKQKNGAKGRFPEREGSDPSNYKS